MIGLLAKVAEFLLDNWRPIVFLILCAIIGIEHRMIKARDLKIIEAKELQLRAEESQARAEAVLREVKAQGDRQAAALITATAAANDSAARSRETARRILSAPIPKDCDGAMAYLATEGRKSAQEWSR